MRYVHLLFHLFHHWMNTPKGCNLSALLEAMQDQFSKEPPVYSKPKNVVPVSSGSLQSVNHGYAGKPPPPVPPSHTPSPAPPAIAVPGPNADRPTLPPKPGTTNPVLVAQASDPIRAIAYSSPPSIQNVRQYIYPSLRMC